MNCYMTKVPWVSHPGDDLSILGEKDGLTVLRCSFCGLIQVDHTDKEAYLDSYRTADGYFTRRVMIGHESYAARLAHDVRVSEIRVRNLLWRLRARSRSKISLLDIGCGNGGFIKAAISHDFDCLGVDLSPYFTKCNVEGITGASFMCRDLIAQGNEGLGPFDVITFHDSFEHFLDPVAYVEALRPLHSPGGLIVVEMPDTSCNEYAEEGMNWRHMKPKEHPFLYREQIIADMFRDLGVALVDVVYPIPGRMILYLG